VDERFRWDGTPLTLAVLDAFAKDLSRDAQPRTPRFSHTIHVAVIYHFLGQAWYKKHAHIGSHPNSYLLPEFDGEDKAPMYSIRILNFAEMLFNLQNIPGFSACLEQLHLNQLQSGLAELQVGMVLQQHGVAFRYIDPAADPKNTCDLEIILPSGDVARGEVKCKYEDAEYSDATLTNALAQARKQIGSGHSGIVFVKIPQTWVTVTQEHPKQMAEIVLPTNIIEATKAAFRGSTRIKKVIFYIYHVGYDPSWGIGVTNVTMEMTNPQNGPHSSWTPLLLDSPQVVNWITIPELITMWSEQ